MEIKKLAAIGAGVIVIGGAVLKVNQYLEQRAFQKKVNKMLDKTYQRLKDKARENGAGKNNPNLPKSFE